MRQFRRPALAVTVAVAIGCGDPGAGTHDGGAVGDAGDLDGAAEAGCQSCDDQVRCTLDSCEGGECRHEADDELCATGFCDAEEGCVACLVDDHCDDGIACTAQRCVEGGCVLEPDDSACEPGTVCKPGLGCIVCADDEDCDDGIECTVGSCAGDVCVHVPEDGRCPAEAPRCDADQGCVECLSDEDCDDGLACTGVDRCQDNACAVGAIPDCDDGVACTVDSCIEGDTPRCDSVADHGLCRADETCNPSTGCAGGEFFYANTSSMLYRVSFDGTGAPAASLVGAFGARVTDLALSPDGVLYGCTEELLLVVDHATADVAAVGAFGIGEDAPINGLTADPDGTLYASSYNSGDVAGAWGRLYTVDPETGAGTLVGPFGGGLETSGDIVWVPGRGLIVTIRAPSWDAVASVDSTTGAATVELDLDYANIYGLTAFDGELLGLSDVGEVLSIDLDAGTADVLGDLAIAWWGSS